MSVESEAAERMARRAGEELLRRWSPTGQAAVRVKGRARDLVTEADHAAEALLLQSIAGEFPGDGVMSEESRPDEIRSGRVWVVDPLDGTVNFAHGIPVFSVSVGFLVDGVPAAACVHAPRLGETFTAASGEGTRLDGRPVSVSAQTDLARALLCTGFAYRRNEVRENNLGNFARMALHSRGVRRLGSAALDLAFVAAGRFDGYWEPWLSPWDVAAGVLLVREAGGTVTEMGGGGDPVFGGTLLATNGRLHGELDSMLTRPAPGDGE